LRAAHPGVRMDNAAAEAGVLRNWLFERALPLWWEVGADHARGGFHEAIDLDGKPVAHPHRARTIARQAFSYCEAGRLSWNGPWQQAAQHALRYFREYFIAAWNPGDIGCRKATSRIVLLARSPTHV
jgi:mannose/cellobiose epimerase-like protein (N-acyl-D-glucosamine 2-epimerase family)